MKRKVTGYSVTTIGDTQLTHELTKAISKALKGSSIEGLHSYSRTNPTVLTVGAQKGNDIPNVSATSFFKYVPEYNPIPATPLDEILRCSIEDAFRETGINFTIDNLK